MTEQYNLDDYLSSRSNSNEGIQTPMRAKSKSVSQSYNITDEDIQYFKNINNNSKLNDKVSLSSVGSTKTIDSVKRPSENFLGSFMSSSNMKKSSSSMYNINKSPPRPRSPGKENGFMMTSKNLLVHDNRERRGSFDLFDSNQDKEESFINMMSSTATPMLIPDNTTTHSKDTIIIEKTKEKELVEPMRASTGTSDNSDLVMSHKSQPSTTITDQTSEETKDSKFFKSESQSSIGVIFSPYEGNDSIRQSDDEDYNQDSIDDGNKTIDTSAMNNKARYMFQSNNVNYVEPFNNAKVKSYSSGNKLETENIPTMSETSLHYYQMTPSQRLRYRREQSKNKVKHTAYYKEYVYDSLENYEKSYYKHGNIYSAKPPAISDNSASALPKKKMNFVPHTADSTNNLIWNVPISSTAVMSMNQNKKTLGKNQSPDLTKPISNQKSISPRSSTMPMTPVYGVSSRKELIDGFNQTSLSLTDLYLFEINKQNKEKINERLKESEHLPSVLKEATEEGFDEAKFVSKEKLNSISSSRPSWLPVKETKENHKHEQEIYRTVSNVSIEKMNLNKKFSNLSTVVMDLLTKNNKLLRSNNTKDTKMLNSNTVLTAFNKNIFEYPFIGNMENRLEVYEKVLMSEIYKNDIFEGTAMGLKAFKGIDYKSEIQDTELQSDIKQALSHYDAKVNELNSLHAVKEKIPDFLLHLCYLKKVYDGKSDLKTGIVLYELLLRSYGLLELQFSDIENLENKADINHVVNKIWDIEQLINKVCFNAIVKEKYDDRIMNKRGLVSQMMKLEYGFDSEFDSKNLNFDNFISTLVKLPYKLSLWVLDIIVLNNGICMNNSSFDYYKDKLTNKYLNDFNKNKKDTVSYWANKYTKNNYKILVSLTLNILLDYHFGYDDFNELKEISVLNYNLLGLNNKNILELLTSNVSTSYNAGVNHRNSTISQLSSMNTNTNSPRRLSKLNMRPNSIASMSRSSSTSQFMELTSKPSIRSSQLINEVTDMNNSNEDLNELNVESIDFMNLVTLDLMGMRMYSCTDEDEDDYVSIEGFIHKWLTYYKKF